MWPCGEQAVALPQSAAARRGDSRSEEGEKAVTVTYIRRRVSVAAVKGQCISLLRRLEVLGPLSCWEEEMGSGPGAEVEEGPAGNAPQ
jgi:hypothetical protein